MKKFFLITIITITLGGCQGEKDASVPTNIVNYFEGSSLPAAIMGSTDKDGKSTWYAFGPSTWGGTDTISKDHIFRFFSMTKAIASVAALQLVERDLVGLDDPLNELMPEMVSIPVLTEDGELVETDKAITLRLLLNHTAGFGYDIFDPRLQVFDRTGWKYEGGQILKPETVEMMLENQLPDGLTLDFGIPEEGLPTTVARFPDESDTYGLAWAIEDSEDEMVRPKGSVYWAGYANSYFTLDKKNGVAIVYFTQILPFNDKESFDFYKLFEKEIYAGINNK
jgi:CubicO group peptidase (beta-lactamase class C family)